MNKIVRLPSEKETARAEADGKKAWFAQIGSWWRTDKGQVFLKLDLIPDTVYMLSVPREDAPQQEQAKAAVGVDQEVPF